MRPSIEEPWSREVRNRLTQPADVEFALSALLGPAGRDIALRSALAARLPRDPTVDELVGAIYGTSASAPARLAHRLIETYFLLDPPLPASGGQPD